MPGATLLRPSRGEAEEGDDVSTRHGAKAGAKMGGVMVVLSAVRLGVLGSRRGLCFGTVMLCNAGPDDALQPNGRWDVVHAGAGDL